MEPNGRLSCPHGVLNHTLIVRGYAVNHYIPYCDVHITEQYTLEVGDMRRPFEFRNYLSIAYCPWLDKYYVSLTYDELKKQLHKEILFKLRENNWVVHDQCAYTAPNQTRLNHDVKPLAPAFECYPAMGLREQLNPTQQNLMQEVLAIGASL